MKNLNVITAITLVGVGLITIGICIPLYLGKIKRNYWYGFRIRKAFESDENWYRINRYGAKVLMSWSVVLLVVGFACLFVESQFVLTVANLVFIILLVPVVQTVFYARRL